MIARQLLHISSDFDANKRYSINVLLFLLNNFLCETVFFKHWKLLYDKNKKLELFDDGVWLHQSLFCYERDSLSKCEKQSEQTINCFWFSEKLMFTNQTNLRKTERKDFNNLSLSRNYRKEFDLAIRAVLRMGSGISRFNTSLTDAENNWIKS